MKFHTAIKLPVIILLVNGLVIGCSSTTNEPSVEEPVQSAPVEAASAPKPQPVVEQPSESSYTVSQGDNLWDISAKPDVYNNPYQWPLIYKKNNNSIKDADLIYPGQELSIDSNPSSVDVNNAVKHAKTRGSWTIGVTEDSDQAYLAQ
ncbi:MAG: LysM peptidoglycan-binding domain-containing protein [Thiohalomonadales bacterium]